MKSRLVWKLSAVVVAILTVAIALSGYANNLIGAHYSLRSARAFLRFNSESIVQGIGQLMMSRNNKGIENLIVEISRDSTVYRNIRLASHPSGEVVASRSGDTGITLLEDDKMACAVCHDKGELDYENVDLSIIDTVLDKDEVDKDEDKGRGRVLSVVAPIANKKGCSTAACHTNAHDREIFGVLVTEYSLQPLDEMANDRRALVVITMVASLSLGIIALWLMFTWLLERPISGLIAGTKRIAANQLDFRFDQKRNDEIGVLEASFNKMIGRIQAHRDELRGAMEYLSGIVENSADIIITVTPDGFIETFNRGAEQALGYSRYEVIGKRIEMLFADPRERDVAIEQLQQTDNVKNYEIRFLGKDGEVRNVLLTLSWLRDGQGKIIGTFGISKNMTEEKRLQRELVQSQKFAAIGQAVTGIQHAIKNMLNALKGGAYLVRNGMARENRERIEEGWVMVEEGIERIADLSSHMLHFAREWKPELERANLNRTVEKVCEVNKQAAADKGVTLRCELPAHVPTVVCDPKLIHMAATDIVVNAIDACAWKDYPPGENPEVVLKNYSPKAGDFVIEISDNGCGMTEDIRSNIFTPFFSTKKTRGTGLGLALTARIIKVHGGEVSVESEPDRGTTFHIHLPVDGPKDI